MKRAEGAKNFSELTETDKNEIIEKYFQCDMTVKELTKFFNLTKRTMPALLKEKGINSARKNRYTLNEHYFDVGDTERKAYWLGYLYADGFVGDEHFNNIVFVQKQTDGYIVEQFARDIEFSGKVRLSKERSAGFPNGQRAMTLNFSSKIMANALRNLNMFTCKSLTMEELPPIDRRLMRHFIRGYFDGDGSISRSFRRIDSKGKNSYSYHWAIIGTVPFLEKLNKFLPVRSCMRDSHTPQMKYLNVWWKDSMEPLFHFLYNEATVYLERKFNVWNDIMGDLRQKENGINSDKEVSAA